MSPFLRRQMRMGGGSSGPTFSLAEATGAVRCYDARQSEIDTVGSGVTRWEDLTGNADATDTHSTASQRPDYNATGLNGFPTLEGDGASSQYLQWTTLNNGSANPFSLYTVFEAGDSSAGINAAATNCPYHDNLDAGGQGPRIELWDGSTYRDWQHSLAVGTAVVASFRSDGTRANTNGYFNKVELTVHPLYDSGTNFNWSSLYTIFSNVGATAWNGKIAHWTFCDERHSVATMESIVDKLMADYGVS